MDNPSEATSLLGITDRVDLIEDAPFWGSALDMMEIGKLADEWLANTSTSHSVRQIVLESWLLVDFWIRMLIAGGLGIDKFNTSNFDLRYQALPEGFDKCLSLLRNLRLQHEALPTPIERQGMKANIGFWMWLKKKHRDVMENVLAAEEEFNASRGIVKPSVYSTSVQTINVSERQPTKLPLNWLETVARLDDDWIAACRRLNTARNLAAHSTDVQRIAGSLGIAGDDSLELVRRVHSIGRGADGHGAATITGGIIV